MAYGGGKFGAEGKESVTRGTSKMFPDTSHHGQPAEMGGSREERNQ